jgi:hypothetical protein
VGRPASGFKRMMPAGGASQGTALLDLNHTEESSGGPDVCIAAHPSLEKIAFLHMDNRIPLDSFELVRPHHLPRQLCQRKWRRHLRDCLLVAFRQRHLDLSEAPVLPGDESSDGRV